MLVTVGIAAVDAAAAEASQATGTFRLTRDATAGEAYVDIYVAPVDDSEDDDDETVKLTLVEDGAYTIDGDNDDAEITITDNYD